MGYAKTITIGDSFDFGSPLKIVPSFSTVATDNVIGSITLPSIPGTLKYVFLSVNIGRLFSSDPVVNYTAGSQNIVVNNGGADVTAITVPNASLFTSTPNVDVPGCLMVGNYDVKAAFSMGGTTTVTWKASKVHNDVLILRDVQCVARVVME